MMRSRSKLLQQTLLSRPRVRHTARYGATNALHRHRPARRQLAASSTPALTRLPRRVACRTAGCTAPHPATCGTWGGGVTECMDGVDHDKKGQAEAALHGDKILIAEPVPAATQQSQHPPDVALRAVAAPQHLGRLHAESGTWAGMGQAQYSAWAAACLPPAMTTVSRAQLWGQCWAGPAKTDSALQSLCSPLHAPHSRRSQ